MQVLEMGIPGKGHEHIGYDQQDDRSHESGVPPAYAVRHTFSLISAQLVIRRLKRFDMSLITGHQSVEQIFTTIVLKYDDTDEMEFSQVFFQFDTGQQRILQFGRINLDLLHYCPQLGKYRFNSSWIDIHLG